MNTYVFNVEFNSLQIYEKRNEFVPFVEKTEVAKNLLDYEEHVNSSFYIEHGGFC